MPKWEVIQGDCRLILPTLEGIDAIVTDPPYGIGHKPGVGKINATVHKEVIGDDEPYNPVHLLAYPKVLIWGANHCAAHLPSTGAWLAWDKVTRNGLKLRIAEYEFAWTNATRRHQGFRHMWSGAYRASERGTKWHPCQKPVALLKWCLDVMKILPGQTVADPYCGSGSLGVACVEMGINYVGIEIDPGYCDIARRRITEAETKSTGGFLDG